MATNVQSIITSGSSGTIIQIECHLSNNLPTIVIVGFANKAVDESRERIRGAFASSHIMLPRKRVTINLAPADIPKDDSGFDLAIAVAIMVADGQITKELTRKQAFIGELGLDGSVRAVRGLIGKILIGRAKGISKFFIPQDNLQQAQLIPGVELVPIKNLEQIYNHLCLQIPAKSLNTGSGKLKVQADQAQTEVRLSEIVGQEQAKRALEIAAAGGHNIFFNGPPGTGKSMLARALASILPALTREESLEVSHLHSLASHDYERIISVRPFRTPHHSASHVAIVGGGNRLRPGEISLAHRGVLFLDEMPEFGRETLEALRQPLEDRFISVARVNETARYPASFILVGTANPCPCGYFGSGECRCKGFEIMRYRQKLSGPILDRVDLYCHVGQVQHDKLLTVGVNKQADEAVCRRVEAARQIQARRYGNSSKLNSDMAGYDIKLYAKLASDAVRVLNQAARQSGVSARGYMRSVKVARTIADLENSSVISAAHIIEALRYRTHNTKITKLKNEQPA